MKKHVYVSMAAVALLAASCSNEDFSAPAGGEGNVVFTAELPALGSRAYGDGLSATDLKAYVYSVDGETPEYLFSKEATFDGLHATVELALVTGKTYDVVFWAQAPDAPYTYSTTERTISVTYDGAANDESRDAFFVTEAGLTVNGPIQKTVQLKRPFAQLNVLTSDYAEALASGVEVKQTGLTMELPSVLNLADGKVDELAEVTFNLSDLPTGTATVGDKTYTYLSMNYILAAADKAVADVKVSTDFALNAELSFTAVPVQRNYRTNIYGALLTNPAVFDVEILPGFDDNNNVDISQQIAPGVFFDEATKTYTAMSTEGLVWLNAQSKASPAKFKGCTMKLGADIDLAGVEWTPMRLDGNSSWSTFDGDNHTVSNMTVSDPDAAGFFGYAIGYIRNVKFTNATVTGNYKAGVVSGDGLCSRIDNVHVDGATVTSTPRLVNGKYDDANNVGGITGYLSAEPNAYVTNCSVSNATITAYRKVGGLVGATNGAAVVTGNTITNVKVIADMTEPDYDGAATRKPDAGEVVGTMVSANATVENNTASNVSVSVLKPADGTLAIDTPEALKALAGIVKGGNNMAGITVKLTADIALDPTEEFAPIGCFERNGTQAPFCGTFDGDNHTIRGLYVNIPEYKVGAGLFGYIQNATVRNLTLASPVVKGTAYAGALVGLAYKGSGYCTIENVTVDGAAVLSVPAVDASGVFDGGNNVGGLIGITQFGIVVKDCTVRNSTVTGYAKVGGMFGLACYGAGGNVTIYENNKVENTTVKQSLENAYESSIPTTIGAFAGQVASGTLPESNTTLGVEVRPAH